jgi:hypothetical protein
MTAYAYLSEKTRLPISEQEIDALYREHSRLGHEDSDGGGECYGCLELEDLAELNEKARIVGATTPTLVREFVEIKQADARGDEITYKTHARLGDIVRELRTRGVLD